MDDTRTPIPARHAEAAAVTYGPGLFALAEALAATWSTPERRWEPAQLVRLLVLRLAVARGAVTDF